MKEYTILAFNIYFDGYCMEEYGVVSIIVKAKNKKNAIKKAKKEIRREEYVVKSIEVL